LYNAQGSESNKQYVARTCFSHQSMRVTEFDQLATIAYVDTAYCRCRLPL